MARRTVAHEANGLPCVPGSLIYTLLCYGRMDTGRRFITQLFLAIPRFLSSMFIPFEPPVFTGSHSHF